jgi:hypothetical protein
MSLPLSCSAIMWWRCWAEGSEVPVVSPGNGGATAGKRAPAAARTGRAARKKARQSPFQREEDFRDRAFRPFRRCLSVSSIAVMVTKVLFPPRTENFLASCIIAGRRPRLKELISLYFTAKMI